MLTGPAYVILRKEFSDLHSTLPRIRTAVNSVLVFLGGADSTNVTTKVLRALEPLKSLQVTCVVGLVNPHAKQIFGDFSGVSHFRILHGTNEMDILLSNCDFAIGAGGVSTWERFCLGVPSVVISVAHNQFEIGRILGETGLQIFLGDERDLEPPRIQLVVQELMAEPRRLMGVSLSSYALVDGQGCVRICDQMESR